MSNKKWKIVNNSLFAAAIAVTLWAGIKFLISYINLPAGACPIDDNRPLMYTAIGFLIVYLIISTIIDRLLAKKAVIEDMDNDETIE